MPRTFQTEQQKVPGHQKVPPQPWANWGAWSPSWGHLFLVGMRGALIPSRDEQKHEQPWEGWRGEGYDECHRQMWGDVSIWVKSKSRKAHGRWTESRKQQPPLDGIGKTTNEPERASWGDRNIPYQPGLWVTRVCPICYIGQLRLAHFNVCKFLP